MDWKELLVYITRSVDEDCSCTTSFWLPRTACFERGSGRDCGSAMESRAPWRRSREARHEGARGADQYRATRDNPRVESDRTWTSSPQRTSSRRRCKVRVGW